MPDCVCRAAAAHCCHPFNVPLLAAANLTGHACRTMCIGTRALPKLSAYTSTKNGQGLDSSASPSQPSPLSGKEKAQAARAIQATATGSRTAAPKDCPPPLQAIYAAPTLRKLSRHRCACWCRLTNAAVSCSQLAAESTSPRLELHEVGAVAVAQGEAR